MAVSKLTTESYCQHSVIVTVLVSGILSSVVSQTCPSYTAGYTGTDSIHESSSERIYVNEASAHRAPCDGTVYAWHYCYYDAKRTINLEVAFGAYRAVLVEGEVDQYTLRSGSYYLLHLDSRETSFTCDNVTLEESEYFQIYQDDRVGACLKNYINVQFLDILAKDAPDDFSVGRSNSGTGRCQESDMSDLSDLSSTTSGMVLHLYVDINVDECELDEDNCHETLAMCTDIVGGENSFTCTCMTGYTGNGVTCTTSDSESDDRSDFVVVVAVVVAAITLIVVLLVGGFLTIHLFRKKNPISSGTGINLLRSNSISCEPATSAIKESMATTEESGISEMSPVSVGPNTRCGVHVEVPPPDVSPNMAYSPHENVSPRNALANAIAINPNEAYGVPAEVNISSTNHSTDAAIVVNPNEAYGVPTEVNISSTNHPTDAATVVNPNEAYGVPAEVNISSTTHSTDATIVVNPNEAYGVPAKVNISSTNHPTDAAIVVNPNEAYGAIDIYTRGSYCRKP